MKQMIFYSFEEAVVNRDYENFNIFSLLKKANNDRLDSSMKNPYFLTCKMRTILTFYDLINFLSIKLTIFYFYAYYFSLIANESLSRMIAFFQLDFFCALLIKYYLYFYSILL
jgi:hypothetical protein